MAEAGRHHLQVKPLEATASLRTAAYAALKQAIAEMDIYEQSQEIRLDERQLCDALGVSRTPVREAMALLEQEGFVRSQPRRGIFVVRKTKAEIVEIIVVWAALEGMAARLAAERASDEVIQRIARTFDGFSMETLKAHLDAYSDANVRFHQAIIKASGCELIRELVDNIVMHARGVRKVAMRHEGRAERSLAEHRGIIQALVDRDGDRAERLVREHNLGLARHVEDNCDDLE